jgi:hypothetical protein
MEDRLVEVKTVSLTEAARTLGVKVPNARAMLNRYGIQPVERDSRRRPRFRPEAIEGLKLRREQDTEARDADRRRRKAQMRRAP